MIDKKFKICLVDVTGTLVTGNISLSLVSHLFTWSQFLLPLHPSLSSLFPPSYLLFPISLIFPPLPLTLPSPSLLPLALSLPILSLFHQVTQSFGTANDSVTLWQQFESEGQLPGATNGSYVTGATSASVSLSPMETAEITIVLGWFYPDRDFLGLPVGQYTVHTDTYTYIHVY